ncbi:uncharacterized protein LOC132718382 isoform X1 [Ruditapes philippinarum]|uniref:uncharacterized protein LOC132718382 isoform X1 n=1 Tax=Ruditapes philippinarum TaxID=129788 RepID=UPI00295BB16F|nr:uncharacterized protein LOC132718382 isoform X1 [Ruditapes philippinarum]
MGENPQNYNQRLAKSAFKDILISANNDDVIIPTSATFDKVVLHIGIGNRSGVTIEKPPVGDGKKLITSVEYATRKFKKSYYQRDRKDTGATENVSEDTIEPGEKFRRDTNNQTDIDRHMLQLASSFYSTTPLETETASAIVSETGLTKQVQPENNKNDADTVEAKLEKISTLNINDVLIPDVKDRNEIVARTKLSTGVESQVSAEPNIKPDIDFDKFDKTCLDALRAKLSIKEIRDAIDKAYENEMLAIAVDEEANVPKPNEIWQPKATGSCLSLADDAYLADYFANSERGSEIFAESTSDTLEKEESLCENDLSKQTNAEDDTGTCVPDEVTNTKIRLPDSIEKYVMISKDNDINIADIGLNDQECISEVVKISTVDQECGERVCIESLQTKPATNGEITQREDREREQGSVSDLHDEDEDIDSVTLETGVHVESTDTMSDSDEPETVVPVHIEPDKLMPSLDTPNDNVDIESDSKSVDKGTVDEMSDSDTLEDIVDMELDDEVVDIIESDDEIMDNIDIGIEDIEAIVLQDQDELDVTTARNYITGNSTNDNGITGDGDNVFGILDIYVKSNLHFDVDKITAAEQCDEKKDYGYIFFSFSTFFK